MIRSTLTAALSFALVAPASAATMSTLPLGDGLFQAPDGLVVDLLLTGQTEGKPTERDVDSNRDNAQSFTITADTIIDKIVINYSDLNTSGTSTTFEFFRVTDANASGLIPDGDIIDSITFDGSHAAFNGNTHGTLIFDVIDTLASQGDMFAIRFDTGAGTSHSIKWKILDNHSSASYDGGTAYENNSAFAKIYAMGVVAVPEPASLALLGAGGLMMMLRRRDIA